MKTLSIALLLLSSSAFASDHIDGPVTMKHRVADLTDFYAFPTVGAPGFLTIILNTYPLVPSQGHFSEKVSYTITLRQASIKKDSPSLTTQAKDEVTLRCTFVTPRKHKDHVATCATSNGIKATASFNEVGSTEGSLRLFFGMRSDPFFFNSDWAKSVSVDGQIPKPTTKNTMDGINVLSLVMELDMAKAFPGNQGLFALTAEAYAQDTPTSPSRRMDRVARPEITNVSLIAKDAADLRDQYNLDQPFHISESHMKLYKDRLASNVAYYDSLDGKKDWADADRDLLATTLADDALLVDIAKPCSDSSFLEIERSLIRHKDHVSCGGRRPADDIMDAMFSLYISGIDGARVSDGVDAPGRPLSQRFPYLAEPDLSILALGKAFIARKTLGI